MPGFLVYSSDDLEDWEYQGKILKEDGVHSTQKNHVRHPSVAIVDGRAFIFYFVQPFSEIENHPERLTCYK